MDTKWNSTKALAGFLAFALGMTLVLSSLGAVGNRIAWERDPVPRWEWDWQETDNFRDEASRYLRRFLTIGAGGTLDIYDSVYQDEVTVQEEAIRSWWGFGETANVIGEARSSESVPVDTDSGEPARAPDADYQADKNVLYYIRKGEVKDGAVYSNAGDEMEHLLARSVEGYNFYLQFVDGKVSIVKDGQNLDVYGNGYYGEDAQWFVPGYENFQATEQLDGVKVVMAIRETPISYYSTDYRTGDTISYSGFYYIYRQVEQSRSFYRTQAVLVGAGLACLALWFLLRKSTEPVNRKIASWTVHVWTEARFLIGLLLVAGLLSAVPLGAVYYFLRDVYWSGGSDYSGLAIGLLRLAHPLLLPVLFWLAWLLHNDHKYNPKEARRSLLGPFLRGLRARDLKRPVQKRLSRWAVILGLCVFLMGAELLVFLIILSLRYYVTIPLWSLWTLFLLPVLLGAAVISLFQRRQWALAKDLGRLADQVEAVRAGDLSTPLTLPEDADLRQTAESLNDIQAGMRAALEEQTRSERMKVELVSNVSHDLKTPLTSILSYAELLRQEEDLPPAAADYAAIIDQKAQRLKTMVEDVFEISKAAADQLPVHLETLDLSKLLRQTLADMDGAIQASALTFRVDLPGEPVLITADGKRLYRVFQNLIDNALRYALEGSRVYLTLKTAAGAAEASVRNTSRGELPEGVDFTARFVRGDASRTDGGSGLGLSIAKSFVEACGGAFRVETVADLFTAIVTFPVEEQS